MGLYYCISQCMISLNLFAFVKALVDIKAFKMVKLI